MLRLITSAVMFNGIVTAVMSPAVAADRPPPPFEVVFTVDSFRDLSVPGRSGSQLSGFTMTMPVRDPSRCYLVPAPEKKVPSIRVLRPGTELRFRVVGAKGEAYLAVAVTFTSLADPLKPTAVACETGPARPPGRPFGRLELRNGEVLFEDRLPGTAARPQTFTRYKFSVLIQRVSDGALGLIDPDVENENLL